MDARQALQIARAARRQEAMAKEIDATMLGQRRTSWRQEEWDTIQAAVPDTSGASTSTLALSVLLQILPVGQARR